MKNIFYVLLIAFTVITSCKNDTIGNRNSTKTISNKKEFLYQLDSGQIVRFFKSHPFINEYQYKTNLFYKKRKYHFAWLNAFGFNESASNFINLITNDINSNKNDSLFDVNKLKNLHHLLSNTAYESK